MQGGEKITLVVLDATKKEEKDKHHSFEEGNVFKKTPLVVERVERKSGVESRTSCGQWQSKFSGTVYQRRHKGVEKERGDENYPRDGTADQRKESFQA